MYHPFYKILITRFKACILITQRSKKLDVKKDCDWSMYQSVSPGSSRMIETRKRYHPVEYGMYFLSSNSWWISFSNLKPRISALQVRRHQTDIPHFLWQSRHSDIPCHQTFQQIFLMWVSLSDRHYLAGKCCLWRVLYPVVVFVNSIFFIFLFLIKTTKKKKPQIKNHKKKTHETKSKWSHL